MSSSLNKYHLATGEIDKERLRLVNKFYNPQSLNSLVKHGLKENMAFLEYGCGFGYTTIDIAKKFPSLHITAIDSSQENLVIATENAKLSGITNIKFIKCDLANLASLNKKFDCMYGRWVLCFNQQPKILLQTMQNCLNPNGILIVEDVSQGDSGHFSYPNNPIVEKWHQMVTDFTVQAGNDAFFANNLYKYFKELNFKNINLDINQQIFATPEAKSIYRLSILTVKDKLLANKVLTQNELDDLISKFSMMEQDGTITGFYRNLFISGVLTVS